jgi:hypothetical protein
MLLIALAKFRYTTLVLQPEIVMFTLPGLPLVVAGPGVVLMTTAPGGPAEPVPGTRRGDQGGEPIRADDHSAEHSTR